MKTSKTTIMDWQLPLAALLTALLCPSTQAVLLKGSGDPTYNTTPPTGTLQNSGWQYQGQWGSFLGTVIGPNYFIAAKHVGGAVGQTFVFQGISYRATAFWDDPGGSDLRIWKVDGLFPIWAPLYSRSDEQGKPFVVIGRGTQRGEAVILNSAQTVFITNIVNLKTLGLTKREAQKAFPNASFTGNTMTVVTTQTVTNLALKGWKAGASDGVMRWGQNTVSSVGGLLTATFDESGDVNEAYLSGGDSSGAVFISDGGVWKLAGINYGIEGPFGATPTDTPFYGALFDKSGLYSGSIMIPLDGQIRPTRFYVTRISSRVSWITSIIGQ